MILPPLYLLAGFVAGQRLAELWIAQRNTRHLLAAGAVEHGAGHYPLFIALHLSWLVAIVLFTPPLTQPNLVLIALFLALQAARLWVVASLGRFWTTRIISLPGAPLVRRGPYRFIRHPNYWIVAGEIALLPLAFGQWEIAVGFSLASAALTLHRIRIEEAALAGRPG